MPIMAFWHIVYMIRYSNLLSLTRPFWFSSMSPEHSLDPATGTDLWHLCSWSMELFLPATRV